MSSSLLASYHLHMHFLNSCSSYMPQPFHPPSLDHPITFNKRIWSPSLWNFHKFLLLPLHQVQILSLALHSQTPSNSSSPVMYLLQWFSNVWDTSFWPERNQYDLFNIHFNIVLPYKTRSAKLCLSFRSSHQNAADISPPCVAHDPPILSSWFDHPNNVLWGVKTMKQFSMSLSPASSYFYPHRPKYLQHLTLEQPHPTSVFFC